RACGLRVYARLLDPALGGRHLMSGADDQAYTETYRGVTQSSGWGTYPSLPRHSSSAVGPFRFPGTRWQGRMMRVAGEGHNIRTLRHDQRQTSTTPDHWRNPGLSGFAAARHRRLPAYDRAALCRPREIDSRA